MTPDSIAGAKPRGLLALAALLLCGPAATAGSDPVAELGWRLASGRAELAYDAQRGYLASLLEALGIPESSQLLVFSKTSAQFRWISPRNPRAIYFNDDTYVGWVPGAPLLEISVAVPGGAAAFYTLRQDPVGRPRIERDHGSCLQCHESQRTLGVPGHLTRSVYPAPDGLPHFGHGTVDVDHATPVAKRWGGWFVTGQGPALHRGNATGPESGYDDFLRGVLARPPGEFFNSAKYLTPRSDVVAHLVLAHQTRVHNAIAKAAVETRAALEYQDEMERLFGVPSRTLLASVKRRIEGPSERLVRDLLMAGEAPLHGVVAGFSRFARDFQRAASRDGSGRSLRDLDLGSRLFRYPCSYLIRSPAYAALPPRAKAYVERRIAEILDGTDTSGVFEHLSSDDRLALRELLEGVIPL